MGQDSLDFIKNTATQLGDTLTGQTVEGGHATVYFGNKYVYKLTERKVMEKSTKIHSILSLSGNSALTGFVPRTILYKDLGEKSLVVEEFKEGHHPDVLRAELLLQIKDVLRFVHEIPIKQVLTNFEGDELPLAEYWGIQFNQAQKFKVKLEQSGNLLAEDSELIGECLDVIKEVRLKHHKPPSLVMVYKDVHSQNILVDDAGKLSAIVDWDSAMSGPVELEYAVLWHRYPKMWSLIRPDTLDKDTFVVAGLVQALRFWKSFSKDLKYIEQQRNALSRTLNAYKKSGDKWLEDL